LGQAVLLLDVLLHDAEWCAADRSGDVGAGPQLVRNRARYGRGFAKVDRFFPSTRMCSACGSIEGPKGLQGLRIRSWICSCGAVHDRDENAELNIRREGRRIVAEGRPDT
jgi:hypothetical protein